MVLSRIGLCLCFFNGSLFLWGNLGSLSNPSPNLSFMSACLAHLNLNRGIANIAHTDANEVTFSQAEHLVPWSKLWTSQRPKIKGQPSSSSRSAPASSSEPRAIGLPTLRFLRFTILRLVAVIQILFKNLEGQLVLHCLLVVLFLGQVLHIFGTTSAISERSLATVFILVSARSLLLITIKFCTLTEGRSKGHSHAR